MLYGLLMTIFILNSLLLLLIVMVQQGKGNMGLGNLGGATQMLFGGTGGQDIMQKTTWVLGTIFMALSLLLALMKTMPSSTYSLNRKARSVATQPINQTPSSAASSQVGE